MAYKRVLTVQDISCLGQCSLTVALPILSACGVETCVLPSAVLSSHTGGFQNPHFHDLTEDMPLIAECWQREGVTFDGILTGYLGSVRQIDHVQQIFENLMAQDGKKVVDPAMADHGKLYKGFGEDHVAAMKRLCCMADVVIPNMTEACMLTDLPIGGTEPETAVKKLHDLGIPNVIITGVSGNHDDQLEENQTKVNAEPAQKSCPVAGRCQIQKFGHGQCLHYPRQGQDDDEQAQQRDSPQILAC